MVDGLALQTEQVAFRQHARDAPFADHRHMAQTVPRHQQSRIHRGVGRAQGLQWLAHHGTHRCIQRDRRQHHPLQQVVPGQDAGCSTIGLRQHYRADPLALHGFQCLPQPGAGRQCHHRSHMQLAQRPLPALLVHGQCGLLLTQAPSAGVQKDLPALLQKAGPDLAALRHAFRLRPGNQQAEAILQRRVVRRRRLRCQQILQRKQLTGLQVARFVGRVGAARRGLPLQQDVQIGTAVNALVKNAAARRVVALRGGHHQRRDIGPVHGLKRHLLAQLCHLQGNQVMRRLGFRALGHGGCSRMGLCAGHQSNRSRAWAVCASLGCRRRRSRCLPVGAQVKTLQ